jgi:hypothetical protein
MGPCSQQGFGAAVGSNGLPTRISGGVSACIASQTCETFRAMPPLVNLSLSTHWQFLIPCQRLSEFTIYLSRFPWRCGRHEFDTGGRGCSHCHCCKIVVARKLFHEDIFCRSTCGRTWFVESRGSIRLLGEYAGEFTAAERYPLQRIFRLRDHWSYRVCELHDASVRPWISTSSDEQTYGTVHWVV